MKIILHIIVTMLLATMATTSHAVPPIWEPVFGPATGLVGDNQSMSFPLGFEFPFAGNTYNSINISTNGGVALGNNGVYGPNGGLVDVDIWEDLAFETKFTAVGAPLILIFATDLDNADGIPPTGTVHFNPVNATTAVVTWDGIATNQTTNAAFITFQLILESDGTITFGYDGITGDLIADLDQGIVVGVSNGDGTVPPGGTDLSAAGTGNASGTTPTVYEIWCYTDGDDMTMLEPACFEPGHTQDTFDLADMNIIFQPNCGTGLAINNIGDFIFACVGTGGGGCNLKGTGRLDPLLWLLVLVATVGLVLRRRTYKSI